MVVDLETIYKRRFRGEEEFRNKMWQILCNDFFQKYIPKDATVLEIAAGYCEFINNISAKRKIALDLNPDIKNYAKEEVETIGSSSTDMRQIKDYSCDIVFISNFFEHLSKEDILITLREAYRVLKTGGKILILQPNIRFCYKDYWNFFDHVCPLDDKSLTEVLEINNFKIIKLIPKFLPYSTKSKFLKATFLIKLYLKFPILYQIFGKQTFICAQKIIHKTF
ncbi:MAG: class I SAM-dependent methyltransferase [Candidatus Omnitrophota bacterium]